MLDQIKFVTEFVQKHKVAFSVIGTAAACLALARVSLKQKDDFLRKHNLYDEFYGE